MRGIICLCLRLTLLALLPACWSVCRCSGSRHAASLRLTLSLRSVQIRSHLKEICNVSRICHTPAAIVLVRAGTRLQQHLQLRRGLQLQPHSAQRPVVEPQLHLQLAQLATAQHVAL